MPFSDDRIESEKVKSAGWLSLAGREEDMLGPMLLAELRSKSDSYGTLKLKEEVGNGLSRLMWSKSFISIGGGRSMPAGGSARSMLSACGASARRFMPIPVGDFGLPLTW